MIRVSVPALLLCAATASVAAPQAKSPLGPISSETGLILTDEATVALIRASSGDVAHEYVRHIAVRPRVEGTPEYRDAVEWVAKKAREIGLSSVSIERYPADGVREYLGYRTKRAWTPKSAGLSIVRPFQEKLTSYADLAISLCRNSVSGDVTAELVDVGRGLSDSDYRGPVRGKLVLTSSDPALVYDPAVKQRGAAGIISYWSIPEWDRLNRRPGDYPDLVGWRYLPEPEKGDPGTFAFMISSRRAGELQQMLASGPVELRAAVDATLEPGTLDVLTAVIPGTVHPDEEITVTAHLDEVGAEDNASGSAALLEMGRTVLTLVHSGQFPPPSHTIRFVWGPEYSGTAAWLAHHLGDKVKRIASMNMDQLGANLLKAEGVYQISRTPDSTPSYLNAVLESTLHFVNRWNDVNYPAKPQFQIISTTGTRNRLQGRMVPYTAGSDHEIYNKLGVPAAFITVWPEKFYHSSDDTPDKVDPTQLHRSVFMALSAVVTAAYASDADAKAIAELSAVYGRKHVGQAESKASGFFLSAKKENLGAQWKRGRILVNHVRRIEAAAVRSAAVFATTAETRASIESLEVAFGESESLEALAKWKASSLGVTLPKLEMRPEEESASRIYPKRNAGRGLDGASVAFANTPSQDVESAFADAKRALAASGESSLRLMGFADAPAFYANGQRSVLEIRDDFEAEYGAHIEVGIMLKYFEAFRKAGIMDLVTK